MKDMVPELHDTLKLTILPHYVSDLIKSNEYRLYNQYFPTTKTWRGILEHHCPDPSRTPTDFYPTEIDTFYLAIADNLASALSRPSGEEKGAGSFTIRKLWGAGLRQAPILTEEKEIIDLFKFLATDPSWTAFFQKYETLLKTRPEDAHPGRNITSLYTHCKLTGQFYRLLKSCAKYELNQKDLDNKLQGKIHELMDSKMGQWQLTVTRCKFHFFQNPFRARDLNIFKAVEDLTREIKDSYPDNVLFKTSDELLLVVADEIQLPDIVKKAHQKGFWVEIVKAWQPLNSKKLHPNPEFMPSPRRENLYALPHEISPPICDLCQVANAVKQWPEDYVLSRRQLCPICQGLLSQMPLSLAIDLLCPDDKAKLEDITEELAREDLCENCFSLRAEEPKLPKLDRWRRDAQSKIAWLRINLSLDQLTNTLAKLYSAQFPSKEIEIRFSVIGEFQEDYSYFLQEFNSRIRNSFRIENVEKVMNDFFCIKVGSFKETLKILQVYHHLLENFFPAFLDLESSPLKIAVVCANSKFPFFEVWKIMEEAEEDILISLQGGRILHAPIKALRLLIEAANMPYRKSALHKLAKIEETSKTLAELVFQNRRDEDSRTYSRLDKALRPELDFSSIFTFARLMGD